MLVPCRRCRVCDCKQSMRNSQWRSTPALNVPMTADALARGIEFNSEFSRVLLAGVGTLPGSSASASTETASRSAAPQPLPNPPPAPKPHDFTLAPVRSSWRRSAVSWVLQSTSRDVYHGRKA